MIGIFGIFSPDGLQEDIDFISNTIQKKHYTIRDQIIHQNYVFFTLDEINTESSQEATQNQNETYLCSGRLDDPSLSLDQVIYEHFKNNTLDDLKDLEGSFAAVWIDENTNDPMIVNDRNGTIRVFYCIVNRKLVISSRFLLMLDFIDTKTINPSALASFLLFGYPLEQDTLIEEIKLLPPGSILSYSSDGVSIKRYYDYLHHGDLDRRSEEELCGELRVLWEKAVEKRINHHEKNLILLSGGLDSRAVLAATLSFLPKNDIVTASYGEEKSFDSSIAKNIAKNSELTHHQLRRDTFDFEKQYRLSLQMVDAMIDATPYYPFFGFQHLNEDVKWVLSGFFGGELMGPLIFPKIKKNYHQIHHDTELRKNILFNHHIINDLSIVRSILNPQYFNKIDLLKSFGQSVDDIGEIPVEDFYEYCAAWMYRNEVYKCTVFCNMRFPDIFSYQTPFFDYDLVDFMLRIPPEFRMHKRLYKTMMVHTYPDLFSFPTKNSFGLPLRVSSLRIFLRRLKLGVLFRVNLLSTRMIKKNLVLDKLENYLDYNDLIRTNMDYREFVRVHLDCLKRREFFDADAIDSLWNDHLKGKGNHMFLFGLLVTFDLFMETYIDN